MRTGIAVAAIAAGLGLAGCNRNEPAARQAGRTAYELSQKTKEAAKKAEKELRKAGKEAREGWNEAKRESRQGDKR